MNTDHLLLSGINGVFSGVFIPVGWAVGTFLQLYQVVG